MKESNRDAAHPNVPQRLNALGRCLVSLVAVAETPVRTYPPREELPGFTNGEGF
jgi:hypothetical protein